MSESPAPKKRRGPKSRLKEELVAATLAKKRGNMAASAREQGVSRAFLQEYISTRPILQQVLKDAREGMLDYAETALFQCVKKKEAWSICFLLKTQGKSRGYVERPGDETPAPVQMVPPELITEFYAFLGSRRTAVQPTAIGPAPVPDPVDPAPRPPELGVD